MEVWMWWLCGAAYAAEAILALEVVGPDGSIRLMDELGMPSERILSSPDAKHLMRVYVAPFDGTKAVVELAAGKPRDGKPKVKVAKSFELTPYQEHTDTLVYKDQTWTVKSVLGEVWDAPEPTPAAQDTTRYVLAWDDAALLKDPMQKPAKNPKDPKDPGAVVRERELPEGRTDPLTQASPMKLVAPFGDGKHLELEVAPPGPMHCQEGGPPAEGLPPKNYVAISDLVPRVTAREVSAKAPDGTGYRVAAGVPVTQEGEGIWRVATGGLSFLIQAGEEDLAFYYRPSTHFETGTGPRSLAPGVVGKTSVGEVSWSGTEPLPIVGMRGVKMPVATVRVPCAEVRLQPAPSAMK
jgi:hypothetical protein